MGGDEAWIREETHEPGQFRVLGRSEFFPQGPRATQNPDPLPQFPGGGLGGAALGFFNESGPHQQFHGHLLARVHPFLEVPLPGAEAVHPAGDGIAVAAQFQHLELTLPAVVDQGLHRRRLPVCVLLPAVQQLSGQDFMAVGDDIRFDLHPVAHHPLDGETAAIDGGFDAFDAHPFPGFTGWPGFLSWPGQDGPPSRYMLRLIFGDAGKKDKKGNNEEST